MEKRQYIIIATGILVFVIALALYQVFASFKETPEKKTPPDVKRYVRTTAIQYDTVPTVITAHGRVKTAEALDLIPEVAGRMHEGSVPLKEGQRFGKGALLFKIDDTEARLSLQAQKSTFLKDIAAILPDIKIDHNKTFQAWEAYFNTIDIEKPLPELPGFQSEKEKIFLATKNIFSNYYNIKRAEANLQKYNYYAPFSGNIYEVSLQSGSYVNPGSKIARVMRSDQLELEVSVEPQDIGWIQRGTEVLIESEGNPGKWAGRISRIGEYVNKNTQSIDVYIALHRNEYPLYDGQFLKAVIPGKTIEQGMVIPRNALFNNNEVYVLEDSLLKVKKVDILKLNKETVVFAGIPEGNDIVVEPLVNAHNNMKAYKWEEGNDTRKYDQSEGKEEIKISEK